MAPIALKRSPPPPPTTAATATAAATVAAEARGIVRDAVRSATSSLPPDQAAARASAGRVLCFEEVDGRSWRYEIGGGGRAMPANVKAVPMHAPVAPVAQVMSFISTYVVPEGFPDSVAPSYVPYMSWRALQHFFGGAIGVFTTQTLLSSVGMSGSKAAPGAVAINWIIKDGAGRLGKMLFARQGKKFDCDLKQLRFAGDLLMELGAAVELATAAAPQLFLPLACVANVAKNVAAVTSTSTRTPVYKAYAKGENIGDVTAKGECIGNIADLLGTGLGILIAKQNPPLAATFALLSCGYLFGSYQEIKSVELNTLNRARFGLAVQSFIQTGIVPSLKEGNSKEKIFDPPWMNSTSVVLGPRFGEAFQEPTSYAAIRPLFKDERYLITYNPSKDKIYALFKEQVKPEDIIKAAFHAHVLSSFVNPSNASQSRIRRSTQYGPSSQRSVDFLNHIAESCNIVSSSYDAFKDEAAAQGWIMSESLLNPGRARLCGFKEQ